MMRGSSTIGYDLRILKTEHLWMPAGLWALFALLTVLLRLDRRIGDVVGGYLGAILPLTAGILAAPLVVDDAALELQLAAPRAPWRLLAGRLAALAALIAIAAIAFQLFVAALGIGASQFGSVVSRQAVWVVPVVALMGLASVAALAGASAMTGSLLVGLVWMVQMLMRSWFNDHWLSRHLFLFLGIRTPDSPDLVANRIVLVSLGILFVVFGAFLLRRQERYL